MRRVVPLLVLIIVSVLGGGCTKLDPEVAVNDQVPADQQLDLSATVEESGASGEVSALWVADGLAFVEAPSTMTSEAVIGLDILGGLPHNVVFEGFQGDSPLVEGTGAGSYVDEVSVPAGSYTYYCSISGHREAGMEGSITVE